MSKKASRLTVWANRVLGFGVGVAAAIAFVWAGGDEILDRYRDKPAEKLEGGIQATRKGLEKTGEAVGESLEKTGEVVEESIEKAGRKTKQTVSDTGTGIRKKADEWIEDTVK